MDIGLQLQRVEGWKDRKGVVHEDYTSAVKAESRHELEEFMAAAISGYDYEVDYDMLAKHSEKLSQLLINLSL